MKWGECERGAIVLATKKSHGYIPMSKFLFHYPLSVAKIVYVREECIHVGGAGHTYTFQPEDLILLYEVGE